MTEATQGLIILVDDSDEDYEALARALRQVAPGCTLMRFDGGRSLFAHRLTTIPLVVLLDLNLPDENGLRVLHRLRSDPDWRVVPIVIYSGSKRPHDIAAAYASGAAGYLQKTFHPGALLPQTKALWSWWAETVQRPEALTFARADS